jgi:hypothetical protein
MARKTTKTILEGCRAQAEQYGMDGFSIRGGKKECCCPRGLIRAQIRSDPEESIFSDPSTAAAKTALMILDKVAISLGSDGFQMTYCGHKIGDAAEEYAKIIGASNKKLIKEFFDKALELA